MPAEVNSYSVAAKHYDAAYAAMRDLTDAPFYLELARQIGGPVLEIGCGTGRVLLPIAREGIEIHGLDNSAPMLVVLRDKLSREEPAVRDTVVLHSGDMRGFQLGRKFRLVTIPFRPMQHMHTVEDQAAALKSAAAHLAADGILAFDVFYPKFETLLTGIGEERLEAEWTSPIDPAISIRRYYRKDTVDQINQTYSLTFVFRSFRNGELVLEETDTLEMSYYTYPHLRALFPLAGLEIAKEYGSFEKTPLDNSATELIFLLRKAKEQSFGMR